MGYKYLLIDSQTANTRTATVPYTSEVNIRLDHPIENATSVQMISFSTPNNMHNVRGHNNRFECMLYNMSLASPTIERRAYQIEPGLYTITELVDSLNAAASASPFGATPTSPTLTPVFSLSSTNKVSITCSSSGPGIRRFVLFASNFWNSIAHRLGFSENQIFTKHFDSKAGDDFYDTGSPPVLGQDKLFWLVGGGVFINSMGEMGWRLGNNPLVWRCDGTGETLSGKTIGFEAYQYLLMKSSLVSHDFESIYRQSDGVVVSKTDNILQKIDTNVPLFSYLHWGSGGNVQPFVHKLSGKTIQSFSLELTDDTAQPFKIDESKHWSAVLRFEIAEENNQVTRETSLINQILRFKASHDCSR